VIRASVLFLTLSLLVVTGCVKQQENAGGQGGEENEVYAVVNGQEIKAKDVQDKIKNDLQELKRNEYEIKKRATEEVVQQKLVEEEAKKQGTTIDKIFSQFDSLKDGDVSPDDIKGFLKSRNIEEKKLTKQEKDSIPQIIKMQRVYEARQKFVQDLRAKANVQFKIPKPPEEIVNVDPGHGTPWGSPSAKVTIVEFSDFQCPFCARGRQRLDEVMDKYKDKVKVYFRYFPLESIHPMAFHAAEAAACALDQNKFWEYHNMLFDHQDKLDEKSLIGYAKDLKLDGKSFEDCLKSHKHQADIHADQEAGQKVGVNSTPTFFVDGHAVRGAQPIEAFSEIIDESLAK